MSDGERLSRRERQIMGAIYSLGQATVLQVQGQLPDPPTPMAVRRTLHILEEKGHLRRRKRGREVVYSPKQPRKQAGLKALRSVLGTYFQGSLESAMASHLMSEGAALSRDEKKRLRKLIDEAREKEHET